MKAYCPVLTNGPALPPQTTIEDKLGGLPWGLPPSLWPHCKECGKPLSHVAQLQHHADRLDLGAPGRVLMLFQCEHDPGMCETWDADSGANAVLILNAEDLQTGLTAPPSLETRVLPEARIESWTEIDEPVGPQDHARFFDWDTYKDVPEDVQERIQSGHKLGGSPYWIQAPEHPGAPYRWAGQLDSMFGSGKEGPNFGDGGLGYLFVHPDPEQPSAKFLWQCG